MVPTFLQLLAEQSDQRDLQDKVIGYAGAFFFFSFIVWLIKRVLRGKPPAPKGEENAIVCRKCGYYLVPADTNCPKCNTPVT